MVSYVGHSEGGEFGHCFRVVIFAVTFSKKNFNAFKETLGDLGPCCGDGSGALDYDVLMSELKLSLS